MAAVSYFDVFDIPEHVGDEEIRPGDLVRTSENLFPHYRVIAVHQDKVWVRNEDTGVDGLTTLVRCRKINGQPALADL
jgi:hypothetical protein